MNVTAAKSDKHICQKSILMFKDAVKHEIKGHGWEGTKKHVTFNRFIDYHIYTENSDMEEMQSSYLDEDYDDDDWGLSDEQLSEMCMDSKANS
ncbi:uncharacterized protein Dmoj_GI20606 [Drosophila mojavensis]|uniref:Uncharacterized protein n=1 Tax=Drosophila mojavensis TaxID=7230 RepID=B4KTP0_DROMO|nr:uncharacterized protein Dmoj_GI20606 [Drosophila mojavensis]